MRWLPFNVFLHTLNSVVPAVVVYLGVLAVPKTKILRKIGNAAFGDSAESLPF